MAKSAAQLLLGTMHDVLQGFLELIGDPDARAGAGLNPNATADTSAAQPALDRISAYFNSDNPDGEAYLKIVDDVIAVHDALLDIIQAIRFAGDATPVLDYLNFLLEVDGLNVIRGK